MSEIDLLFEIVLSFFLTLHYLSAYTYKFKYSQILILTMSGSRAKFSKNLGATSKI